jgi:hypothetical protein
MKTINRAALIVRPKEPYLRWAASVDEDSSADAGSLRDHVSIYLVAEDPRGEQETAPLENYYERIFEAELEGWYLDENKWPEPRDLKMFMEWFDARGESLVVDLEASNLGVEEF